MGGMIVALASHGPASGTGGVEFAVAAGDAHGDWRWRGLDPGSDLRSRKLPLSDSTSCKL